MVTLSDFTERQLLSDYKFLEEASRLYDVAQRSEAPRPARQLPLGLQNFVDEVSLHHSCQLQLLLPEQSILPHAYASVTSGRARAAGVATC